MTPPVTRRTACNRDCPDACEILATVQDGRISRLSGAPDHPVTQGFLCRRTSRFLERQYSPDRLTHPLRRRGDHWHQASWDVALDEIADAMLRIRAESSAAAILHYRCGGSMGIMKNVSDWFFQRFGPVTVKSGDVCSGAGEAAQVTDFGVCDSNDLFDLHNSRTIVLWGKNIFVSSVHLIPLLNEAKRRGARLILIDPVHQRTSQLCDLTIQPRAGGDAALACGMARWLVDHQRHDTRAATYCDNWAEYERLISSHSVEQWAAMADVTPQQLGALAHEYAQGPAAILIGWGLQRRQYGSTTVRAIDALAAMSGNLGVSGGGASFYFQRRAAFDFSFVTGEDPPRAIPEPRLGPGIFEMSDPPIRMAWVTAANPVATLPESRTMARALASREMTVVVDSFLTDTARCADWVLPTTTFLEEDDLLGAYGHHWIAEMRPVVKPPAEVKSDYAIVQQLAQRVGLADEFSADVATWKRRLLQKVEPLGINLERLGQGAVRNPFATNVLFASRHFPTPTGKVNLLTELPPACTDPAAAPPLRLAALSTDRAQSSQWLPHEQTGPATATVHPSVVPGAAEGQLAEIESAVGVLKVRLSLDNHQRSDIVLMEKGGWLSAGRCANALIPAQLTDAGQCAVYYDTPVQVRLLPTS